MTRPPRAPRALLLLALVALPGCTSYRLIRGGDLNAAVASAVERKLVATRGLDFKTDVPIVTVPATEARTMLEQELRREYAPAELAALTRIYAMLGLLPRGTDLERTMIDLYGSEIAGFYDPISRRMVLVADALRGDIKLRLAGAILRRDIAGEFVLAHELTHALQDQHFGLDLGRGELGEDDAQLARRAVYEGDATLAGVAASMGTLARGAAKAVAGRLESVPGQLASRHPDLPPVLRDTLAFQYSAGVNFVSWAYDAAGFEGVNALLARPPRSTEQILHPEKYYRTPELPLAIRVGALAPFVQSGWELLEEATLGELLIRILLAGYVEREQAIAGAAGWDGDRLSALAKDEGLALMWVTAWDSERDASEFAAAMTALLARQHPGAAATRTGANVLSVGGREPFYLERRGAKVLLIEGPLEDDLADLADRVWRRTTFEPTMPWLPLELAAAPGTPR